MQASHEFFGMLGAAAATLLGLLFVSVSLNAKIILGASHKHSMQLAEQAFHNYIAVLMISLVVFFPGVANHDVGLSILAISASYSLWLLFRFYRSMVTPLAAEARVRALRRYGATLAGFVALIFGGAQMASDNNMHTLIAFGSLVLLVAATGISWELLIRIGQSDSPKSDD